MNDSDESLRDVTGKTLAEVAPHLYREVVENLERRNMSPAARVVSDDEIAHVLERLQTARIREACACGQLDCQTYRFTVPDKGPVVDFHTLRLYVDGDLLVHFDGDSDIYKVERLYDLTRGRCGRP